MTPTIELAAARILESLPDRFSAFTFHRAGLSPEDASTALMVTRGILEHAEREYEHKSTRPPEVDLDALSKRATVGESLRSFDLIDEIRASRMLQPEVLAKRLVKTFSIADELRADLTAERDRSRLLVDSLRNLHVELKGAQLMIFDADTPEKRSEAFKCVGAVVAWLMAAESDLREKGAT